jgi:hypothetical protein
MSNTFKKEEKKEKESKGFSAARFLAGLLNGDVMQNEGFAKNISYMVYLVVILIMYLSYGYYAENSLRDLMKADAKLKGVKAEYVTSKSILEKKKLQSKIAETVASTGLKETLQSPYKIRTEVSYFEIDN